MAEEISIVAVPPDETPVLAADQSMWCGEVSPHKSEDRACQRPIEHQGEHWTYPIHGGDYLWMIVEDDEKGQDV